MAFNYSCEFDLKKFQQGICTKFLVFEMRIEIILAFV